jgi:hypothetical protein
MLCSHGNSGLPTNRRGNLHHIFHGFHVVNAKDSSPSIYRNRNCGRRGPLPFLNLTAYELT